MTEHLTAPLRLVPRLDPKPWGGRRLNHSGFTVPPQVPIGELVATAGESTVADGPMAGRSLRELAEAEPLAVSGARGLVATGGRPHFPVLVKLIDAVQDLSVQLDSNKAAAAPLDCLGKTEAWHVLDADADSVVALGLRPDIRPEKFTARCRAGQQTADLLRWLPARPG